MHISFYYFNKDALIALISLMLLNNDKAQVRVSIVCRSLQKAKKKGKYITKAIIQNQLFSIVFSPVGQNDRDLNNLIIYRKKYYVGKF